MITVVVQETRHVVEVGNPDVVVVREPVISVVEVTSGVSADLMRTATPVTVDSGAITVTPRPEGIAHYIVAPETGSSDTLDTINGAVDSRWLVLRVAEGDRINFANSGNIRYINANDAIGYIDEEQPEAWLNYIADYGRWLLFIPGKFQSEISTPSGARVVTSLDNEIVLDGHWRAILDIAAIASDRLTDVTGSIITVDPETGTSDDLASLEMRGNTLDSIVFLTIDDPTFTITIKHNNAAGATGFKFFTVDGSDIVLNAETKWAIAIHRRTLDSHNGGWALMTNIQRQAAFVNPATATAAQIATSLINAGLMASS